MKQYAWKADDDTRRRSRLPVCGQVRKLSGHFSCGQLAVAWTLTYIVRAIARELSHLLFSTSLEAPPQRIVRMSDGTRSHSECNEIQNEPVGYHLDVSGFSGFSRFERQTFRDSGAFKISGTDDSGFPRFPRRPLSRFSGFPGCACVRVCMRACMNMCLPACLLACLLVCVRASCMCICTHMHAHARVCLLVCLLACLRACLRAFVRVCVLACLPSCVPACTCKRTSTSTCTRARVHARVSAGGLAHVCGRTGEPAGRPAGGRAGKFRDLFDGCFRFSRLIILSPRFFGEFQVFTDRRDGPFRIFKISVMDVLGFQRFPRRTSWDFRDLSDGRFGIFCFWIFSESRTWDKSNGYK